MSAQRDPSERLQAHFRERPWQGADPFQARFLFVGLDANYDRTIEKTLPEVFDYLEDGVAFWREHGKEVHHPFRLPRYHGKGKLYHDRFAEIGFAPEYVLWVSFIELLHVPTTTTGTGKRRLEAGDLSPDHLRWLAHVFEDGSAEHVFMCGGIGGRAHGKVGPFHLAQEESHSSRWTPSGLTRKRSSNYV